MLKNKYIDKQWELKTRVSDQVFDGYDFSGTDFNCAIFENVNFTNCLFYKSNLSGSKLFFNSNFDNCQFLGINFSNTTFGSHKGLYFNCLFEKCQFRGKEFNFTNFSCCEFVKTKFKTVNFNGSRFYKCKFAGNFDDVSFNGIYNTNPIKEECLKDVDFSQAIFGEFVTFYNCDLSTCIPPKDSSFENLLYNIYSNDSTALSTGSKDRIILERH
jgi:uncharacterized protein YjbI with pentapeptide repeats